jgi:pyruvate formate lyase activating enzyme
MFYEKAENSCARCLLCPHRCLVRPDGAGLCGARENDGGALRSRNYGRISSIALDPIEKKPLRRFYPGSLILSVGSFGCNLSCPFCQNHAIAQERPATRAAGSAELIGRALALVPRGNIGIAYTYNEPTVWYEFVLETARLAHDSGLKNVMVTNGYINPEPLAALLPHIDAMNIDLKGGADFYARLCGGREDAVKDAIRMASAACHVEVTTLLVTGHNDTVAAVEGVARWIGGISPDIPLHVTRFFPAHKMRDCEPTPAEFVFEAARAAMRHLKYAYPGNVG